MMPVHSHAPAPAFNRLPADRACAALLRALKVHAGPFLLIATESRPWSSATFEGSRHRIAIRLEGMDADARATRLQTELPEADLDFAGGFVADILVATRMDDSAEGGTPVLGIEALTIDEPDSVGAGASAGLLSRAGRRRCG